LKAFLAIQVPKSLVKLELFITIEQCFTTFFGSWHNFLVMKIFGGSPSEFNRYKDHEIVAFGVFSLGQFHQHFMHSFCAKKLQSQS